MNRGKMIRTVEVSTNTLFRSGGNAWKRARYLRHQKHAWVTDMQGIYDLAVYSFYDCVVGEVRKNDVALLDKIRDGIRGDDPPICLFGQLCALWYSPVMHN